MKVRAYLITLLMLSILSFCVTTAFGDEVDTKNPPAATMGVKECGHYTIWIMLKNGKIYRITNTQIPDKETEFLKWIASGPVDIQVWPCGLST